MKIKRALISVSDKTGLDKIVSCLDRFGVEIISTGGTAKAIRAMGIKVKDVSKVTGFPEIMDGRVKTLHPMVHGSLLARRDKKDHMQKAGELGIKMTDMVIVNLYPFEQTVKKQNVSHGQVIENIDIGGPSMIRSAAKNYKYVAVVTEPLQYEAIIGELNKNKGSISSDTLRYLGAEAFRKTKNYDSAISQYFDKISGGGKHGLPDGSLDISCRKITGLRYGENPHQKAAYYAKKSTNSTSLLGFNKLQGKELSFNNIMDINAAVEIITDFKEPAVSVIKHTNPCGAATHKNIEIAFLNALDSDKLSAFGGIIALNRKVNEKLAKSILKETGFIECIAAPSFDKRAASLFKSKKNLRLLQTGDLKNYKRNRLEIKQVNEGFLIQEKDLLSIKKADVKVVTRKKPLNNQMESLLFGWKIVKHVKSNAIVLSKGTKTVGIGAGQMSRVDAVIIAARKAQKKAKGSTLASDAFFPKPDSIKEAHKIGVEAIIQPGGSIKDDQVIAACNKYGISMVFTGIRHFKH